MKFNQTQILFFLNEQFNLYTKLILYFINVTAKFKSKKLDLPQELLFIILAAVILPIAQSSCVVGAPFTIY